MSAQSLRSLERERAILAEPWAVVYRRAKHSMQRGIPVAAFAQLGNAQEWIAEAPHRKNDRIEMRQFTLNHPHAQPGEKK